MPAWDWRRTRPRYAAITRSFSPGATVICWRGYFDPGFVSHAPGGADAGAGTYAAAVDATHAAFPDLVVTVHDQVAEEDRVVTRWSATGTHAGDFVGVPATGRLITVSGIHIHRVRHGRLAEHWEELNLLGMLRQLGVLS